MELQEISKLLDIFTKIFLSCLLSGLIGWEREMRQKGAGLKTHILVSVGSTLITLTSYHVFDIYKNVTPIDPTRLLTGIVTGIGFLCAGTIIRGGNQIIGLTTAATVWIVSSIGMAVGCGQYDAAIIVTFTIFFLLVGLRSIEDKIHKSQTTDHD